MIPPRSGSVHGGETAACRQAATLALRGCDAGALEASQPGSLNAPAEDSCLDNPSSCPKLFLQQEANFRGVKALKSQSLPVTVTWHPLANTLEHGEH